MRKNSLISVAGVALLLGNTGCRNTVPKGTATSETEAGAITIVQPPQGSIAEVGGAAEFDVVAKITGSKGPHFQWFRNGSPIEGANSPRFSLSRVTTNDVGFYSCVIQVGTLARETDPAELMVYHQSTLTVYGTPIGIGGSAGRTNCPPQYVGYMNLRKPMSPYGWKLTDPARGGAAIDQNRTNTTVRYFGTPLTNNNCGVRMVRVPPGTNAYRFTVYFPDSVPTGPYPLLLFGFNP